LFIIYATVIATVGDLFKRDEVMVYRKANNGTPIHALRPELKTPAPNSKDQRKYIQFYIWDSFKNKFVRLKDYHVNKISEAKRKQFVADRIEDLIYFLEIGTHLNKLEFAKNKKTESNKLKLISKLIPALNEAIESKSKYRIKTFKNYQYHVGKFIRWLEKEKLKAIICPELDHEVVINFFSYLSKEGFARRSINNFKSYLTTIWYEMQSRGYYKEEEKNPFTKIVKLDAGMGKNIAFTPKQQSEILQYCKSKDKEKFRLLSMFMYYTLMRTNEIAQLQIKEIDRIREGYIYLPKDKSKNLYERWIKIGPDLRSVINALELEHHPLDYYVWGKGLAPSSVVYGSSRLGDRYSHNVLRPLNYEVSTHSLYSWKHTGVVAAKMAGVTDGDILLQGGWRDIKSYNTYLKSLGIYAETNYDSKVPSIINL